MKIRSCTAARRAPARAGRAGPGGRPRRCQTPAVLAAPSCYAPMAGRKRYVYFVNFNQVSFKQMAVRCGVLWFVELAMGITILVCDTGTSVL